VTPVIIKEKIVKIIIYLNELDLAGLFSMLENVFLLGVVLLGVKEFHELHDDLKII